MVLGASNVQYNIDYKANNNLNYYNKNLIIEFIMI